MSSFESSLAVYTICIGLPVMLIALVMWYLVRGVIARRVVFGCFAVTSAAMAVLMILWSLRTWPVWFFTVPMVGVLLWALREGFRQTSKPRPNA